MFGMFKFKTKEEYLTCASNLEDKYRKILDYKIQAQEDKLDDKIESQESKITQRLMNLIYIGYGYDRQSEIDLLSESCKKLKEQNETLASQIKSLETQVATILNIVRR